MGFAIAVVMRESIRLAKTGNWKIRGASAILGLAVLLVVYENVRMYATAVGRTTFLTREADEYFSKFAFDNRPVMGGWAPGLTWRSGAIAIPVWYGTFNYKNTIEEFNPIAVISELMEEDSDMAFMKDSIRLDQMADSISYRKVGRWDLKVIWMTGDKTYEERKNGPTLESLLEGQKLIGRSGDFSVYFNEGKGKLLYEKANWAPGDFKQSFFLQTTAKADSAGHVASENSNFEWLPIQQHTFGQSAFLVVDLPDYPVATIYTGQFYFDNGYIHPWEISVKL